MIPTAKESALHSVTEEIKYFVSLVGIGFHPDTDFEHYAGNFELFSAKKARELNMRLTQCFAMCKKYDLDIYAIALNEVKKCL